MEILFLFLFPSKSVYNETSIKKKEMLKTCLWVQAKINKNTRKRKF